MTSFRFIAVTFGALIIAGSSSIGFCADPPVDGQKDCLPETDPNSPRKTKLEGEDTSSTLVVHSDVDKDGDPDVLECWFRGKRVRFLDENDNMTNNDIMGDLAGDCMQVDRDGDSFYDGPDDMNIKWIDDNKDGRAEAQAFAINPNLRQKTSMSGAAHWMVFEDLDDDEVHGYVNWLKDFAFDCWRVPEPVAKAPNFSPDYNGNSIFLKEHAPVWALKDPRFNWENPFAFYDFDGDGCTEQAIRLNDVKTRVKGQKDVLGGYDYDGKYNDCYVTWDLDNDAQRHNEMDFDMTLRFDGADDFDYSKEYKKHPDMRAPEWALTFFRYAEWRKIDEFRYCQHENAYQAIFKPSYKKCWLVFDEDDDDHRWERVELYYGDWQGKTPDPYSVNRFPRGGDDKDTSFGLCGHGQSDTLGDRGEWDQDYSGKGKIYIGTWDQKIHLNGAESGAWTVDLDAKYWGSSPVVGNSSPAKAPKVEEVVLYRDSDNDGFFDTVTYDYDGDQTVDVTINLNDYKLPKPKLINAANLKWQGMHELFKKLSNDSWNEAMLIYQAAWKAGINTPALDNLSIAASTQEKYISAYWLKQNVFRILDKKLSSEAEAQAKLRKDFFSGNFKAVAKTIGERRWN
jgi:hypothetical protein